MTGWMLVFSLQILLNSHFPFSLAVRISNHAIRGNMVIHTVPQSWGSDITLKTLNSQNLQTSCRFMCASATKFDIKYFSRFMWFSTIIIIVNITLRDRQCLNVLSLFSLFLKIWFKNSAIFLFVEKIFVLQWTSELKVGAVSYYPQLMSVTPLRSKSLLAEHLLTPIFDQTHKFVCVCLL